MKPLSIAVKLWLPAIVVSIGLVVMAVGSAVRTIHSQALTVAEQSQQQSKLEMSARWRGLAESYAVRGMSAAINPYTEAAQFLQNDQQQTNQEMKQLEAELVKIMNTTEERAAMDAVLSGAQQVEQSIAQAFSLKAKGDNTIVLQHVQNNSKAALETYLAALEQMVKLNEQGATLLRDKAGAERLRTVWTVAGIMALIIIMISVATRALQKNVCQPLYEIVRVANAIGGGDLRVQIKTDRQDEMGDVLRSLQNMTESLAQLVGQVRKSTDSIKSSSEEIAHGSQYLSDRTENTAANLQVAATSMERLNQLVQDSAESARKANALAASAFEVAESGGTAVAQVVDTMHAINGSSKKIVDIISVIDGIAFQTNILALNAAVEAARAGEQGRGFAVVASEVRSLAGRSAEAAKEIKSLIGASVERVEHGTNLVDQAGATMSEVVGSIQRVTDIMGEISEASKEQASGVEQVGEAVTQMDHATQQNAALVEEMAASATGLKSRADELVRSVAVFKLSSHAVSSQGMGKSAPGADKPLALR